MSSDFELPEVFAPAQHAGTTEFVPLVPGWYAAQITEATVKPTQKGDGTYLLAVFEVTEGPNKGRKVFHNINLQNPSEQAVAISKRLLSDICETLNTGPLKNVEALLYKPMKVRLAIEVDKTGQYDDKNKVVQVRPYDFVPKRGKDFSAAGIAAAEAAAATKAATPTFSGATSSAPSSAASSSPTAAPPSAPATPSGSAPWRQQ